jgi:flagellar operon protein (TIGR03826 family)
MVIQNCQKCGRLFSSENNQKFCERCRENDEDMFKLVREYIYDNPNASIPEVAEETEVPEKKILKFLREGKLELKEDSGFMLDCERCGTAISTGRFCNKCAMEMEKEFKSAFGMDKKDDKKDKRNNRSHGMHIKK